MVSQPVVIDGRTDEWTAESREILSVVYAERPYRGADDISATVRVAWDSKFLYLAVEIVDDQFVTAATQQTLHTGDAVEIWLDTNFKDDIGESDRTSHLFQYGIPAGGHAPIRWLPDEDREPVIISQVVRSGETSYTVEIAIPWEQLDFEPEAGSALGFAINIDDNDSDGIRQELVLSTSAVYKFATPSTLGTLILLQESSTG